MQVFKFGGASVKDADSVKNIATLLKNRVTEPTVIVISAMGKITNKLEELTLSYFHQKENTQTIFDEIKTFHFSILDKLFPEKNTAVYNDIENVFVELLWALEEEPAYAYNFHYDQLVSQGEVLSTKIVSAYLNSIGIQNKWMDVRGLIQTDNSYREGKVDYELSESLVKSQLIPKLNS